MTDYFKAKERDILFRRFEELTPTMRSSDGRINGHQLICHLNNSLREICGEQAVVFRSGFFKRTIGKWLVFHLIPWPESNPRSSAALNAFIGSVPPSTFQDDHAAFIALLKKFDAQCRDGSIRAHPEFGRLSLSGWGQYMFLHLDYHLTSFGIHGEYRASR
jgi:hypothetical protein